MKTAYILIRLFLLVCSCAFCEARRHCGHRDHGGDAPALANAGKAIEEMGQQMKRFTDESTRHFQTMGVSMSNVLKVMSDNAARGINLMEQQVKQMTEQTNTHLEAMIKITSMEQQVKQMTEQTNTHLEAMINTVKDIQTQFLQRVGVNIEQAEQTNAHLEAMINTVKDIQTQFLQRVGVNIEQAEQTNTHLEAMINTVKDIQTQFLQRVGVNIEQAEQTNAHLEAMINTVKDIQTQFLQRVGVNIEQAEQTNTHLEAMINTVKDIQTQFLQRVVNIEEAVANVNTVVKKSHVGLDIGTLILLLFAFFVSRYLRLHTGNDLISLSGYIILSFIELAFLIYAFQLSANILHKRLTGEDIENETLLQLAFGTGCLIVSILVILLVVRLTVTWVLPFIVWSVKTLLVITFGWPLQRNLSIRQRVGFSILCTTVVSVFLYYSTSPVDCAIILSAFLFIVGVCVNVFACFTASQPQATPAPSNEDNEILLLMKMSENVNRTNQ